MNKHEKAFILKKMTRKQREKTMTLESSKNLGGIGAILILVGSLVTTYTFGIIDPYRRNTRFCCTERFSELL